MPDTSTVYLIPFFLVGGVHQIRNYLYKISEYRLTETKTRDVDHGILPWSHLRMERQMNLEMITRRRFLTIITRK
jgi:hypothetical protein